MGRDEAQKAKYFPTAGNQTGNQTAGDQTDGQLYDFGTDQAMQSSRTTNPLFGAVDAVAERGLSRRRRSSVDKGDGYLAFSEDQL